MQTNHLALPVGRAQDLYKFPNSETAIPEVVAAVVRREVQTVALGNVPGVLRRKSELPASLMNDPGVQRRSSELPGQQPDGQVQWEANLQ